MKIFLKKPKVYNVASTVPDVIPFIFVLNLHCPFPQDKGSERSRKTLPFFQHQQTNIYEKPSLYFTMITNILILDHRLFFFFLGYKLKVEVVND